MIVYILYHKPPANEILGVYSTRKKAETARTWMTRYPIGNIDDYEILADELDREYD